MRFMNICQNYNLGCPFFSFSEFTSKLQKTLNTVYYYFFGTLAGFLTFSMGSFETSLSDNKLITSMMLRAFAHQFAWTDPFFPLKE